MLKLANSCVDSVPLRHALDAKLQHLQEPEHIARGLLRYRIQQGSKHIPRLIMKDGKKNNEALRKEVTAGLDTFRQWWVYKPFEHKRSESQHRQTEETRHTDLVYAVLRTRKGGLRRYWRFRAIIRDSAIEVAYRRALIQEAEEG